MLYGFQTRTFILFAVFVLAVDAAAQNRSSQISKPIRTADATSSTVRKNVRNPNIKIFPVKFETIVIPLKVYVRKAPASAPLATVGTIGTTARNYTGNTAAKAPPARAGTTVTASSKNDVRNTPAILPPAKIGTAVTPEKKAVTSEKKAVTTEEKAVTPERENVQNTPADVTVTKTDTEDASLKTDTAEASPKTDTAAASPTTYAAEASPKTDIADSSTMTRTSGTSSATEATITSSATEATILNNKGAAFAKEARYEEALAELRRAEKLDPASAVIHLNISIVLDHLKRIEEARQEAQKAVELDPRNSDAVTHLCELSLAARLNPEALACYARLEAIGPLDTKSMINHGVAFLQTGQYDRAREYLAKAMEREPNDAGVLNAMGIIDFEKKKYKEAAELFKRASEIDPRNADVRYNLGLAQLVNGNRPGAISQYRFLTELSPERAKTLYRQIYRDKLLFVGDN